ncbi:cell division cycle protein 20 homolog B [Antechinus flavipes]|uniref:cell division cycle protein 20 homolog B n=1 Tax=Antechinus flavipes TaxID=38775 RepID=UPI002235F0C3|nr:cell division cycle protein 20 homolog B [Antechinus flavipes]
MEWKLERYGFRRVRTEEEILWENVMKTFAKGIKRNRNQCLQKVSKSHLNPWQDNRAGRLELALDAVGDLGLFMLRSSTGLSLRKDSD